MRLRAHISSDELPTSCSSDLIKVTSSVWQTKLMLCSPSRSLWAMLQQRPGKPEDTEIVQGVLKSVPCDITCFWFSPFFGVRRGHTQPWGHTPQFRGLAVHHLWPGSCNHVGWPCARDFGSSVSLSGTYLTSDMGPWTKRSIRSFLRVLISVFPPACVIIFYLPSWPSCWDSS